jgi:hypothetical protein
MEKGEVLSLNFFFTNARICFFVAVKSIKEFWQAAPELITDANDENKIYAMKRFYG